MVLWRCLLAAGNVIKHCPVCLFKHICLFYDLITVPTRIRNDRLVHGHLPRTHSTSDVIVMPEGPTMFLQGISHMSLHTSSLYILQVFTLPKSHLRGQTSRTHEILASTRSSLECSKLAPLPTSMFDASCSLVQSAYFRYESVYLVMLYARPTISG